MDVTYAFPMHVWKQYGFITEYKKDRADALYAGSIQLIQTENQVITCIIDRKGE